MAVVARRASASAAEVANAVTAAYDGSGCGARTVDGAASDEVVEVQGGWARLRNKLAEHFAYVHRHKQLVWLGT